ncbi:hypothetical protein KAX02_01555 [candidate division WOR-3 bacterium]|nr:hypothetical protein [candidate division WOR-3 bacterium]
MQAKVQFHWKGNHHAYYGIWLIFFGIFNNYMAIDNGELAATIPFWQLCIGIGAFMLVDDIIEHTLTADTPLRILYDKIIKPRLK